MAAIGIIGGTALARLAEVEGELDPATQQPVETPYGATSGPLLRGRFAGRDVIFVMRHGPGHALPPHAINYRANIRALADAGVEQVIAAAAVGGIGRGMRAGRLVIPDQIIDYSWGRAHSFSDGHAAHGKAPLQHVDFTEPYDGELRTALVAAARAAGLDAANGGVHGVTQGPRLETAAEVNRMERDGCDIVGMTGMPEAGLAREAGLAYACCAVVVNAAAGRGAGGIHDEIETTLARGMADVRRLLEAALPTL